MDFFEKYYLIFLDFRILGVQLPGAPILDSYNDIRIRSNDLLTKLIFTSLAVAKIALCTRAGLCSPYSFFISAGEACTVRAGALFL